MAARDCPHCGMILTQSEAAGPQCPVCKKELHFADLAPTAARSASTATTRTTVAAPVARSEALRPTATQAPRGTSTPAGVPGLFGSLRASFSTVFHGKKATAKFRAANERVVERLPSACACCGVSTDYKREIKFAYVPTWVYLVGCTAGALLGYIPLVILMTVTRKMATVPVPLCATHWRPRLAAQFIAGCALFTLLVLSWGAIAAAAMIGGNGALAILLGWAALVVAAFGLLIYVKLRSVRAKLIDDNSIELTGLSPEFAGQASSKMGA